MTFGFASLDWTNIRKLQPDFCCRTNQIFLLVYLNEWIEL